MFTVPLFPSKANRRANKRSCKAKCDHGRNLNVDDGPDGLSKSLLWEDLQEEEQERELNEATGVEVRDLAYPEVLQVTLASDCEREARSLPEEWL
jgi:hypothetical protein